MCLIFFNFLLTSNSVYVESVDLLKEYRKQFEREISICHEFLETRDSTKSIIEELSASLTNLILVCYDNTNTDIERNIKDFEKIENLRHEIGVQHNNLEKAEISLNNSSAKIEELKNLINDIESRLFLTL